MFVYSEELKFVRPIKIMEPNGKGGFTEQNFNAHFTALPDSEMDSILKNTDQNTDVISMSRVWTGWDGIKIEGSKDELPFSEDLRGQLLSRPYVRFPVAKAYFAAMTGIAEKN